MEDGERTDGKEELKTTASLITLIGSASKGERQRESVV